MVVEKSHGLEVGGGGLGESLWARILWLWVLQAELRRCPTPIIPAKGIGQGTGRLLAFSDIAGTSLLHMGKLSKEKDSSGGTDAESRDWTEDACLPPEFFLPLLYPLT